MNTFWSKLTKLEYKVTGIIIVLVGSLIRLYYATQSSLWYDEAYSGLTVKLPFEQMVDTIVNDVHPPLYYALLDIWSQIFGADFMSIRLFSVFIGVLLLMILFWIINNLKLSSLKKNLLLLLFSLSPMLIGYSVEVRSYSLVIIFTIIYYYLINKSEKLEKSKQLIGVVAALLFLTHYISLFIIAGINIVFLSRNLSWAYLKTIIVSHTTLIISFLIWSPVLVHQFTRTGGSLGWIPDLNISTVPRVIGNFFTGVAHNQLGYPPSLIDSFLPIVIGTSILTLVIINWGEIKKDRYILSSIAILFFVTIAYLIGPNMFIDRYLLPLTTLFILGAIIYLAKNYSKGFYILISISILISIVGTIQLSSYYNFNNLEYIDSVECFKDDGINYVIYKYYTYPKHEKKLCTANPQSFLGWTMIDKSDLSVLPPNVE